jgi:hypothetical protein
MKYLYAILSWGMIALGILHMLATFRFFHTLNTAALWFFSGGIALVLAGILNLLHRTYGRIAPGVRRVCIGTNIFMTIFSVVSGIVSHASIAQFTLVLGLIGGATFLSLSRRALLQPVESQETTRFRE